MEYSRGLHDARERFRLWRWVIVLLGLVTVAVAVADTISGPIGEAVVSSLYVLFFPIELLLWPRRQAHLLANTERAEQWARQLLAPQPGPA